MEETIFTKIINGSLPCHKIYEDDFVYAFLDIHPISLGHTLVVSKKQVEFLWDLDDESYVAMSIASKRIACRLREVMNVSYVGSKVIGVDVPHAHIHLVPFNVIEDCQMKEGVSLEVNDEKLREIAESIRF